MKDKPISIVMTSQTAGKIRIRQSEAAPNEMAFMLSGYLSKGPRHFRFLTRDVHFLNPGDYEVQHPGACRPKKRWLHDVLRHCAEQQMHIVDAHAHTFDTSGFPHESGLDIAAAAQMYPAISDAFPGMAVLSMVISAGFQGAEAHIYRPSLDCRTPVDKVIIYGPGRMEILYPTSSPLRNQIVGSNSKYISRLAMSVGEEAVLNNRNLRIGAIGCGSLGEPMIAQCANLGFKITIGDMDQFGIENANRSLFANQVTATRNVSKTEICRRAVMQTNPDADICIVEGDIREPDVQEQFLDCDLLVVSTDNETSRFVANHMAITHGMALFDAATGITVDNGVLIGVQGQIVKVIPGSNLCHECSDFFDSNSARQGLLSEEDFELARKRGYVAGDEIPSPSVMPLNMTMAGIAVWEILRYVTGASPDSQWDILTVDLLNPGMQPHYYQRELNGWRSDCALCSRNGMLLCGETVPLLIRQKGSTHEISAKLAREIHGTTNSKKS